MNALEMFCFKRGFFIVVSLEMCSDGNATGFGRSCLTQSKKPWLAIQTGFRVCVGKSESCCRCCCYLLRSSVVLVRCVSLEGEYVIIINSSHGSK